MKTTALLPQKLLSKMNTLVTVFIPGSLVGENTGCRWMAACCLQMPLSQSGLGQGPGAGSCLQFLELEVVVTAAAGVKILVLGPPHASSLYMHTHEG